MQRIERREYMEALLRFKDKALIKVVTGVRRCGKSTLLQMFEERLLASGVAEEQIVAVNLEDFDALPLHEAAALHAYVKQRLQPGRMTYVFIDEIQHCKDFPAVIDSLYIRDNVDVYLTGFNAYMLSSEIATLLSGRYVEIRMLPLSFREFVEATDDRESLSQKYRRYIETSSFPYALALSDQPQCVYGIVRITRGPCASW